MITRNEAIAIIEASKLSHVEWLNYFEENPEEEGEHGQVGDKQHHIKCIEEYDKVIEFLKKGDELLGRSLRQTKDAIEQRDIAIDAANLAMDELNKLKEQTNGPK